MKKLEKISLNKNLSNKLIDKLLKQKNGLVLNSLLQNLTKEKFSSYINLINLQKYYLNKKKYNS